MDNIGIDIQEDNLDNIFKTKRQSKLEELKMLSVLEEIQKMDNRNFIEEIGKHDNRFVNFCSKQELTRILEFLRSKGVQMGRKVGGFNGLHMACRFSSVKSIKWFLQRGSQLLGGYRQGLDIQSRGQAGTMAHHFAAFDGMQSVVVMLIENGKLPIEEADDYDDNLVHQAVCCEQEERLCSTVKILKYLFIKCPILFQRKDNEGRTPLHVLCNKLLSEKKGQLLLFKYLVNDANVSLDDKDNEGQTPIKRIARNYKYRNEALSIVKAAKKRKQSHLDLYDAILSTKQRQTNIKAQQANLA